MDPVNPRFITLALRFYVTYSKGMASLIAQMVKSLPAMQETQGLIPGSVRSPEEGNGNPLQYSCLENSMDRGSWQATVYGLARVRHSLASKPP